MSRKPTIDFCALIAGFAQAALIDLGQASAPCCNETSCDLAMAEQNIAILELLQCKTKGNLTASEQDLLAKLLDELRAAYAIAAREDA